MKEITLEEFNKLLSEWDDCEAELFRNRPDEQHFTVGLFRAGYDVNSSDGKVGVTGIYCGYISGPTIWNNSKLRCRESSFTSKFNKFWNNEKEILGYELFDENAQFSMHCYDSAQLGNQKLSYLLANKSQTANKAFKSCAHKSAHTRTKLNSQLGRLTWR